MVLPQRLFLYGTLLQGTCNAVAVRLHRHLGPGRAGQVGGQLHAIPDPRGWYPALLPGDGIVHGTVHDLGPGFDLALLAELDDYEDARADARGEYRRGAITVIAGADRVVAEAYLYNAPLPAGARPVPGGDFPAFLERHGLPAFR